MNKKTLKVYDTITGQTVDVEVTQEVYEAYMRTEWNIHDNNESFYKHEIQFSQLIGGDDGAYENFHEFIVDGDSTTTGFLKKIAINELNIAMKQLNEQEKELIERIFFCNMSERKCAAYYGISQKNIHKKKLKILAKLHKLLILS